MLSELLVCTGTSIKGPITAAKGATVDSKGCSRDPMPSWTGSLFDRCLGHYITNMLCVLGGSLAGTWAR